MEELSAREMMTLADALDGIDSHSDHAWLYLPRNAEWMPTTEAAVLVSDEVSPDEEDDPEAGVPELAKARGLRQILPVTAVQDVVAHLKDSRPNPTSVEMITALKFYFERDAFGP